MNIQNRKPLPDELFEIVCNEAEVCKNGLGDRSPSLQFLEDCIANKTTNCAMALINPERVAHCKEILPEFGALNTFYSTVLLRYLNKTLGSPEHVQHLQDFRTPSGNQVDIYLERYFGVK